MAKAMLYLRARAAVGQLLACSSLHKGDGIPSADIDLTAPEHLVERFLTVLERHVIRHKLDPRIMDALVQRLIGCLGDWLPRPYREPSQATCSCGLILAEHYTSFLVLGHVYRICTTVIFGKTGNHRVTSGLRMRQASQLTVLVE